MPKSPRLFKRFTPVTVPPKRRGGKRQEAEYQEPSLLEESHVVSMDDGLETFQDFEIKKAVQKRSAARKRMARKTKPRRKQSKKKTR